MKKIGIIVLMLILAVNLIGCDKTAEEQKEIIKEATETNETVEESEESQETEENEVEIKTLDFKINNQKFKLKSGKFNEIDNLMNLFSLSTKEFLEKFEITKPYLEGTIEEVGIFNDSFYFVLNETVFLHDLKFTTETYEKETVRINEEVEKAVKESMNNKEYTEENYEKVLSETYSEEWDKIGDFFVDINEKDFDTLSLVEISGQNKNVGSLFIEFEDGKEIKTQMTLEEVRNILGQEKRKIEVDFYGEILGNELIYSIGGYEEYTPENKELVLVVGTSKDKKEEETEDSEETEENAEENAEENVEEIKFANYIAIRIQDKETEKTEEVEGIEETEDIEETEEIN